MIRAIERLWAKALLWLLTALTREPDPGPQPKYTERAMREVCRQAFSPRKTHYGETYGHDDAGQPITLATIYAEGHYPMTFSWPWGQEIPGRLAVASKARSKVFRLAHRAWRAERASKRGSK